MASVATNQGSQGKNRLPESGFSEFEASPGPDAVTYPDLATTFSPEQTALLKAGIEITDWPDPALKYEEGVGQISTRDVPFRDGSVFRLRKVLPESQQWGISADLMTQLGTEVDGYNTYIALQLADEGVHSRLVGTNRTEATAYGTMRC